MRTKVLSWGGGVQTRAILRLVLDGRFERPDAIVFADTHGEKARLYREALPRDRSDAEAAGIPFLIGSAGSLAETIEAGPGVFLPAFTFSEHAPEGRFPHKSCTARFKVDVLLALYKAQGWESVETWIGYSEDEIDRVKPSPVAWIENRFPLLELKMRRGDCEAVLVRAGLPVIKSACVFCPNQSRAMWQDVRNSPEDWALAQRVDAVVRDRVEGCETFIHRGRKPLAQVVQMPQPSLFGDECDSGYCGL